MTTSGRDAVPPKGSGGRWRRGLVVAAIAGALLFGGYVGYLEWSNDSFPAAQRPFAEYAAVTSASFNGTEYALSVQWLRPDVLPLYAQLTSTDVDAANTPVCDIGVSSVKAGDTSFMPFALSQQVQALTSTHLSIAMKFTGNGSEFTVVYDIASVQASPGNILPSNMSCSQPVGVE